MIRRYPSDPSRYDVAQFLSCVNLKVRGVGRQALAQVVRAFPGKWQIRVLLENSGALSFWQSAVSDIVGERYQLFQANDVDLLMHFIYFETDDKY